MLKNKDLQTKNLQTGEKTNALEYVEVASSDIQATELEQFWIDLGAQRALNSVATVTNLLWLENISRLKASKEYRKRGLTWEQVCEYAGQSQPTVDRLISDFREFGKSFFKVIELTKISREAYRLVNPVEVEEGKLRIGEQVFAITKGNAPEIEAAIQAEAEKLRTKTQQLSDTTSELKKAREDHEKAKKAATRLNELLTAERDQRDKYKDLSEPHRKLSIAEDAIRFAAGLVKKALEHPELSADEKEMASEFGFAAVRTLQRAFAIHIDDTAHHAVMPEGEWPSDKKAKGIPAVREFIDKDKGAHK
jgi:paraquat-inducible protein B